MDISTNLTDPPVTAPSATRSRIFPWVVFGLTFGLLLSDYMSRQALSAVFPLLKSEWGLSDSQLGALTSIVALMVGLLAFPLSLVADRWGRVRSMLVMATVWSLATLLCALATSYGQMLGARFLVGVGEAAYGSVGAAVMLSVFAPRLRASLSGAFLAGGSFGSVVGVALGAIIAEHVGWRWTFAVMAGLGLLLVGAFRILVTESSLRRHTFAESPANEESTVVASSAVRAPLSSLFSSVSLWCAYIGGGLQLFVAAVLMAWLPSFFQRSYSMPTDRAGLVASAYVLLIGTGMVVCGILTDRIGRRHPVRQWSSALLYCTVSLILLTAAFSLDTGPVQLTVLALGALTAAGSAGATASMVVSLAPAGLRATALATVTLANNVFGLALGPLVVGVLADRYGLAAALRLVPLAYLGAIAVLALGRSAYPAGLRRLARLESPRPAA
ncbi:putative arabinose efflux permease, MFS family [Nocardia amikacinitolerans]|uniref:MFS transporter n=1 Tax=Nocardia amikacinitolerans TaxID=756689 RepID=UPI00082D8E4A|nr:MFS transporter [Nocardia amikacinitolerans]MCP2316384.1 putative arabinose efflux permease, MFS family [Nocardia amikacinitolerans]